MTTAFEFTGTYTKFFKRTKLPSLSSMKAFYLLGTDAASSLPNLVPGSPYPTLSAIGAPTYGTGYAQINGSTNYLKGNFLSTNQPFTHIAVGNLVLVAGQRATYCGYNFSINNRGVSYIFGEVASIHISASFRDAALVLITPNATPSVEAWAQINTNGLFFFSACTYDGANFKVYAHDGRSLISATAAASGTPDAGIDWYIGYGASTGQDFRVAAAGTADVCLTSTQLMEQANYLRKLCRARGLAVL